MPDSVKHQSLFPTLSLRMCNISQAGAVSQIVSFYTLPAGSVLAFSSEGCKE
jgi:hypothetical protein